MFDREELEKRISNANEAGLVVILYEALIDNFQKSIQAIKRENYNELKSINNNSRDILNELIITLQGNSQIASDLKAIYLFLNILITNGENRKDIEVFEKAIKIIEPLYEGFHELEKEVEPKVVRGMSYGKTGADDYSIDGNLIFKG